METLVQIENMSHYYKNNNYVLKNIPNSSEKERALSIMKEAYENLGYDEYAAKVIEIESR